MHNRTLHNARNSVLTAFVLCAVAGCYSNEQATVPVFENPAPKVNLVKLRPPLVITLERTADWNKAVSIPAPAVHWPLAVNQPQLAPVPASADETDGETDSTSGPQLLAASADAIRQDLAEHPTPGNSGHADGTDNQDSSVIQDFGSAQILAGQIVQTNWTAGEALHGAQIPTPVLVAKGMLEGPTLCVTAAVHGDELNGIEAVRRLMYSLNPEKLKGSVIGVPIVNLQGFQRHSRYLADRRDLNRFFPGNPRGSSAARMAHSFFNEVIAECDGLVDLHTGSFHRTNLPQLRADLNNADVLALTKGFGATVILHSDGAEGTLRRAAVDAGIPAVTLEAGEPLRLQDDAVDHTVKALFTLLDTMQMYNKRSLWGNPEPTYYSSSWVRADQGGILTASVKLGRQVKQGDTLGKVTDPISNEQVAIFAPYPGRVIGMALNQFVMPGFATFHLATEGALDGFSEDDHSHAETVDLATNESMRTDESE